MKQGLKNPALVAFAATPKGQEAIEKTTNLGITVLKAGLIAGVIVFAYYKIFKVFKKLKEDKHHMPSNISVMEAKSRAEAIFIAMYGAGSGYRTVELNLAGLNYNGFVRLYNEFDERRSALFSKMDLVEWLQTEFGLEEITKLRFSMKAKGMF